MNRAADLHERTYGVTPDVEVRSPGRVNIIGDHTDYCGLPVLPMAISQSISVAASNGPPAQPVAISTLDQGSIGLGASTVPQWAKYVRAAYGVVAALAPERGVRLAIDSDLPATGGLSSSSALTVGCIIAMNELWGLGLEPHELIASAVEAERSAAIAGGAMDQTVITLAIPGHALRIDFDPPGTRHVQVPDEFVFVAGYSGESALKGESAATSYNSFVLASRAAAALLGAPHGMNGFPTLARLIGVDRADVDALPTVTAAAAGEIAGGDALGVDPGRRLDLAIAVRHVLSEAARVDRAEQAMSARDAAALGTLMDESHASLGRYGSTTPALDLLVSAARGAGAHGARVTGAGFGGWAVALTTQESAASVLDAMGRACGGPAFVATPEGGALWYLGER